MNCELIFYLASKTNLCEKALERILKNFELNFRASLFATESNALGEKIIDAFESSNIVFVIGGLNNNEKYGIENVLSKALANKSPDDLKKLKNPAHGADGYLIRQGGQLLVVLPDEPSQIESFFTGPLKKYLESFTGV